MVSPRFVNRVPSKTYRSDSIPKRIPVGPAPLQRPRFSGGVRFNAMLFTRASDPLKTSLAALLALSRLLVRFGESAWEPILVPSLRRLFLLLGFTDRIVETWSNRVARSIQEQSTPTAPTKLGVNLSRRIRGSTGSNTASSSRVDQL